MDRVTDLQEAWLHQVEALPEGRPPGERLRQARWMLEEYRVSLWAQQLGTAYPVSDQRIRKVLASMIAVAWARRTGAGCTATGWSSRWARCRRPPRRWPARTRR